MLVKELTDWTYAEELAAEHPLMVLECVVTSSDVGESLTGFMHELAAKYGPDVRFFELDLLENPTLASKLKIRRIPTVILYENSVEARRFAGPDHGADIEAAIRDALHSEESDDV